MPTLVVLSGFIDSDVNVRNVGTPTKKVADFRVNTGDGWTSVTAWEDVADKVPPKGAHLIVHGRLRTRTYDKTVGSETVKMYATEVVASQIEQLGAPAAEPAADDLFGD